MAIHLGFGRPAKFHRRQKCSSVCPMTLTLTGVIKERTNERTRTEFSRTMTLAQSEGHTKDVGDFVGGDDISSETNFLWKT